MYDSVEMLVLVVMMASILSCTMAAWVANPSNDNAGIVNPSNDNVDASDKPPCTIS